MVNEVFRITNIIITITCIVAIILKTDFFCEIWNENESNPAQKTKFYIKDFFIFCFFGAI